MKTISFFSKKNLLLLQANEKEKKMKARKEIGKKKN